MQKYYLPINSSNLGAYFSAALIYPHKYSVNRVSDFQNLSPQNLILSKYKYSQNSDCAIEVFITEDELSQIIKNDKITLFNGILPVTRIIAIYFSEKIIAERIVDFARSASFIPQRLIKIEIKSSENSIDENSINEIKEIDNQKDLSEKINEYNRILGGFAFMRLGGKGFMNYSKNYFSTVCFFNKIIKTQVDKIKDKFNLDSKFQAIFDITNSSWSEWRDYIYGNIQNIENELAKNNVEKLGNLYSLNKIINDRKLYILAVLANYGTDRPKNTDALILELNKRKIHREEISLFFGLRYGYRQFSKNYFLNNENYILKFEFKSKLDYYIVESIFNYVFHDKISENLKCFNNIINEKNINIDKFETYEIMDENIIVSEISQTCQEVLEDSISFIRKIDNLKTHNSKEENGITHVITLIEQKIIDTNNKIYSIYKVLEKRIKEKEDEINNLSLLLKKADRTLFDEIDTNSDGILSQTEIGIFMDKIIKAKNVLEDKLTNIETSQQNENRKQIDLLVVENLIKKLDETNIARIAKEYGLVKNQKEYYRKNDNEKLKIRNNIIEEVQKNKLLI